MNLQKLDKVTIKSLLANTPRIVFEVTDACNLKCKYCGYGELYSDYDKRENKFLSVNQGLLFLQYMRNLWNTPLCRSINNNVSIDFYGGEPLLNVEFIYGIVNYLKNIDCKNRSFSFSMTTNATLIHKYIDFLVENNFNICISLDGDEIGTSYRVYPNNKPAFHKIIENIEIIRNKYPAYFSTNVSFNAVLSNRNSVESIYYFFKTKYNKIPLISEIRGAGIKSEMYDKFQDIFNSKFESFTQSAHFDEIEADMYMKAPTYQSLASFLTEYSNFSYYDYNELLYGKKEKNKIFTNRNLFAL